MAQNPAQSAALFAVPDPDAPKPGRRSTGRHEKAVGKALTAHKLTGDPALLTRTGLLALAAALDVAERKADVYATAQLSRELREWLDKLDLLDAASGEQGELDGLGAPE